MLNYVFLIILNTLLLTFFFFNDTATTEIYTLSLHDALPILLAAHDVADAAEHEGPERPDQEPGGERPYGADERASTRTLLEELDRQQGGEAPEDVEVVPLDHVANCRRDDDAAQFLHGQRRSGHKLPRAG